QPIEITQFRLTHAFRLAYTRLTVLSGVNPPVRRQTGENDVFWPHSAFSVLVAGGFLERSAVTPSGSVDAAGAAESGGEFCDRRAGRIVAPVGAGPGLRCARGRNACPAAPGS